MKRLEREGGMVVEQLQISGRAGDNFIKEDFATLRVVGQFNRGFIAAVKGEGELYIIDQHASDECYRFENLLKDYQFTKQPLLCPITLKVTEMEAALLEAKEEVFALNGFEFELKRGSERPTECLLKCVPHSKNSTFGVAELLSCLDFEDSLENDRSKRPSRLREVMASRACRDAIMIGRELRKAEMERVLGNLASVNCPWNCPHGRPTLMKLLSFKK